MPRTFRHGHSSRTALTSRRCRTSNSQTRGRSRGPAGAAAMNLRRSILALTSRASGPFALLRVVPSASPLVDLATMAEQRWITAPSEYTCFSLVERASGRAGFRPRVVGQSLDFAAQLELVAAGVGVALIPLLTIDRVPDGVTLFDLAEPVVRSIFVATRTSSASDQGVAGAKKPTKTMAKIGGEWGIRTPEGLHPTRFPSVRHRPLGEFSWRGSGMRLPGHRESYRHPAVLPFVCHA